MEEFLDSLATDEKSWFAKAIAGIIISDGVVDKNELEFLRQFLSFLDNPEDVNALLELVKSMKLPQLGYLQTDKEKAFTILKYLVQFIIIDDDLHPMEEKFFRQATKLLGFSSDVADKFLKIADHLTKVAIQCRIEAMDKVESVRCVYIGLESCVLSMKHVLNPRTIISLEFYPPDTDSETDPKSLYAPIVGKVHRFDKKKEDIIFVKILYEHSVTINHGVPQYYDPESYLGAVQPVSSNNKSLSGIRVQCRNCGKKDIPFWSLNKDSMVTQDNIFGTTVYTKARSGFDDCDYNRMQVIVCPKCFFASTLESMFHSQGTWPIPLPFDLKYFTVQWERGLKFRQKRIEELEDVSWIGSDTRTEDQAIVAFDLAIETHDLLSNCDLENNKAFHQTLIGLYLMIQAEMLMNTGKPLEADRRLYQVIRRLEPIFSEMNPIMQIRMARSMGMIHLYRTEGEKFSRYKNMLERTAQSSKFKENSPGERTLKASLEAMEHADQNREHYHHGNLTDFRRSETVASDT